MGSGGAEYPYQKIRQLESQIENMEQLICEVLDECDVNDESIDISDAKSLIHRLHKAIGSKHIIKRDFLRTCGPIIGISHLWIVWTLEVKQVKDDLSESLSHFETNMLTYDKIPKASSDPPTRTIVCDSTASGAHKTHFECVEKCKQHVNTKFQAGEILEAIKENEWQNKP